MPNRKAKVAFGVAFGLLLVNGVVAVLATQRFSQNAGLIARTFEIESTTRRVESNMIDAARARYSYVQSGDAAYLRQYHAAAAAFSAGIDHVRQLTRDDSAQQQLCAQMESLMTQRIALLDASIALKNSGHDDPAKQADFTSRGLVPAYAMANVVDQITNSEQDLLPPRVRGSRQLLLLVMGVQAAMFAVPIALFSFAYFLLSRALKERERAESNARHLSARVLQLQDEERRRFARELHDSLGQTLCVAKISASKACERHPEDAQLAEVNRILEQSLNETRTISYLLHPPLLDEMGLASAAKWYVEGFADRSGIDVAIRIADPLERLPHEMEVALFRILQESLINIHRHARSRRADVSLEVPVRHVVLCIRDYGQGIPAEQLERFQSSEGAHLGLGLAGMRERVRERGGRFEISSDRSGTQITVTMPRPVSGIQDKILLRPTVHT